MRRTDVTSWTSHFSYLPVGWQADRIGDEFLLRPGPTGAPDQQAETSTDPGRGVSRPDQQ